MKNGLVNKIARRICALTFSDVQRLFDKYPTNNSNVEDLLEDFENFSQLSRIQGVGDNRKWYNRLWTKYDPDEVEEYLLTSIAGGVLSKILKRLAWMDSVIKKVNDNIKDIKNIDLNNNKEVKEKKALLKQLSVEIKSYDAQKVKTLKFIDKMLNNIDKLSRNFDDVQSANELLSDIVDTLDEIKKDLESGDYELKDEDKNAIVEAFNSINEIEVDDSEESSGENNIPSDFSSKLQALNGQDVNVSETLEEIGFLMREVGNKVQGTVANFLNRNEDKLSVDVRTIINKLHNGDNALVIIAKTNYELLKEVLQDKQYKTFYEQLKKLIEDPYIEIKQSYQKTMKQNYEKEDLAIIQEAFKKYNPKSDFEKILELFTKDIEKTPLPDPNAWRITKHSKEAKIAMKIAKSLI